MTATDVPTGALDTLGRARELAAMIAAAGDVRVTVDPAAVNPPCVLVGFPTLIYNLMDGATAEWHLLCCAPGSGGLDSWAALEKLRQVLESTFPLEQVGRPFTLLPMTSAAPVPAIDCLYREGLC